MTLVMLVQRPPVVSYVGPVHRRAVLSVLAEKFPSAPDSGVASPPAIEV